MAEQPEVLEYHPDAPSDEGQFPALGDGDIAAEQGDQAVRRPVGQVDQFEQGRFARPRGAAQEMKRTKGKFEVDVLQDLGPEPVTHADVLESNHRGPRNALSSVHSIYDAQGLEHFPIKLI